MRNKQTQRFLWNIPTKTWNIRTRNKPAARKNPQINIHQALLEPKPQRPKKSNIRSTKTTTTNTLNPPFSTFEITNNP
jgi:hypothetical protein